MTNTQLINYIRHEMKQQGIVWKKEQELFEMLVPNESWKKYKTSWSNWKREKVDELTKSPHIRLAIGETLFFKPNIWEASDARQKEAVKKGVQKAFVETPQLLPKWDNIVPSFTVTQEQQELLKVLKEESLPHIEIRLNNYPHYFEPSFSNQDFLLKLLKLLYEKGAYDFLVQRVFPALLSHQRGELKVKIMEAHALGSLKEPKYLQSVKLLQSIQPSDEKKVIDLKTSMLSNLRRYHLQQKELSLDELKEGMTIMLKMYHELFCYAQNYHYYPAINLLYILQILSTITQEQLAINPHEVYQKAQASIKAEKEQNPKQCHYYAQMSEFEFLLLLGHQGVERKIGSMLETHTPSVALVQRTKRQMLEFVAMVERVEATLPKLTLAFQKVIKLLEDYEREQKNGK